MHVTANASDSERNGNLAAFVASSKEYLAFQILKGEAGGAPLEVAFAFTGDTESPRFDGRPAAEVAKALKQAALVWLPPRLAKDKDARVFLHNVAPVLGVPAVSLAVSFTHGDTHLWAILTVWQTRFALALPNSSLVKGVLIDDDGRIFASPDLREAVLAARVPEDRLTRAAMTSEAEASFVGYQDRQGIAWLGAFHRLPRYGVTAIVRRDARSQYLETRTIIQRTAYWGWVFVLLAVLVSFVVSSGLTQKLREVTAVTQKIAAGDFDTTLVVRGGDEVAFLGKAVIKMAAQLKNLVATEKEKARIDRELETARVVQNAFFPKTLSAPGRLGVVGHYRSATECGGDWWGHFPLADGRDLIGIGDATGHGVPAALVTAMAYAMSEAQARVTERLGQTASVSPAVFLGEFNEILWKALGGRILMTFFLALVDQERGLVTIANAGHPFPLVIPKDPADERLRRAHSTRRHFTLKQPGNPLGCGSGVTYQESQIALRPGDRLVFYTDGLTEGMSPEGEQWGKRRLEAALSAASQEGPAELVTSILRLAAAHFGRQPLADDVTFVVAEVAAPSA